MCAILRENDKPPRHVAALNRSTANGCTAFAYFDEYEESGSNPVRVATYPGLRFALRARCGCRLFFRIYTPRVTVPKTLRNLPTLVRALVVVLFAALKWSACKQSDPPAKGRVVAKYWERWSSVGQMVRMLMLSIAGGVPPDVAGSWGRTIPVYGENNALLPLDHYTEVFVADLSSSRASVGAPERAALSGPSQLQAEWNHER